MPEQKKRGFQGLEQKIHEMEEEREREASKEEKDAAPRREPTGPSESEGEKHKK